MNNRKDANRKCVLVYIRVRERGKRKTGRDRGRVRKTKNRLTETDSIEKCSQCLKYCVILAETERTVSTLNNFYFHD